MKKYIKELVVLSLQLFMFYIFPLFAGPTDAMGMVLLIILATLLLSFVLGILSGRRIKYLYPPVIAVLFIPTLFLYYDVSAIVHSLWYLVVSSVGLLPGALIGWLIRRVNK